MSAICRSLTHVPKGRHRVDLSLYLVANRPSFRNEELFISKIMESVKGGATCVQFRDHESEFKDTLRTASRLKKLLRGKAPLLVNTLQSIELAQRINAEGVYLEKPFSFSAARWLLGVKSIIGIPVKTMQDVFDVNRTDEIDHISVKVSASKRTCPKNDQLWEPQGLKFVRAISSHRIVAIGGLTLDNAEPIYRLLRSDDGIAMAGGLMDQEDPCATAQKIKALRKKVNGDL